MSSRDRRHASVIDDVPLGFMRRMLMVLVDFPVTDGRDSCSDMAWGGVVFKVNTRLTRKRESE